VSLCYYFCRIVSFADHFFDVLEDCNVVELQ